MKEIGIHENFDEDGFSEEIIQKLVLYCILHPVVLTPSAFQMTRDVDLSSQMHKFLSVFSPYSAPNYFTYFVVLNFKRICKCVGNHI